MRPNIYETCRFSGDTICETTMCYGFGRYLPWLEEVQFTLSGMVRTAQPCNVATTWKGMIRHAWYRRYRRETLISRNMKMDRTDWLMNECQWRTTAENKGTSGQIQLLKPKQFQFWPFRERSAWYSIGQFCDNGNFFSRVLKDASFILELPRIQLMIFLLFRCTYTSCDYELCNATPPTHCRQSTKILTSIVIICSLFRFAHLIT